MIMKETPIKKQKKINLVHAHETNTNQKTVEGRSRK